MRSRAHVGVLVDRKPANLRRSLAPSDVPASAQWVIRVDYESLNDSQVWQKLRRAKPMISKMAQG